MSTLAEIKEAAAALPPTERFVLQVYLADLDEHGDEFSRMMDRRMESMDAGSKMTLEELEARHEALLRQGL